VDANTGYVVGSVPNSGFGIIMKTIDGGISWDYQKSAAVYPTVSVYFPDANSGYTVGYSGTILKTNDGGGPLGVNEKKPVSNTLKLYPNPAKDKCKVQCAKCNIKNIQIFNLIGEKVYGAEFSSGTSNAVEVDLDFPAGIYFVKVMNENVMSVQKLVVE
jgi:hypothetical protein